MTPQAHKKTLPLNDKAARQWVYHFSPGHSEGDASQKDLLGGKGANLAEMSRIGLPVPPGFILSTEVCTAFYKDGSDYPAELTEQVAAALILLEKQSGLGFGAAQSPLLLSVRSGARVSMPGMMDTILNIGLNDSSVEALARQYKNDRFAYDCYRRLIQMYSDVVLGVDHDRFEDALDSFKRKNGIKEDTGLSTDHLKSLVEQFKKIVVDETGKPFPQEPEEQLWGAIGAVFKSWMTPRAVTYRKINDIPEDWGTAVCVQQVVFGNMGETSGTGVAFTRNPSTGANEFYGEFLLNAQGEDVVAGIRTPRPIAEMEKILPDAYRQLLDIRALLEKHYKDMQDIEFTIQDKNLYMLQTRSGKRTAAAALKIAVDMVAAKVISKEDALLSISPASLDQLLHPTLDTKAQKTVLTKALPASPGAAVGMIVFDADTAEKWAKDGKKVILCRTETSPEDIHGMHAAQGILTSRGGMTSHAAVVARGMGTPCICGASDVVINLTAQTLTIGTTILKQGDFLTIDGSAGEVLLGQIPMTTPQLSKDFETVMGWADETRRLKIRTNADTPHDAATARGFGAEGIGLCRTEHMFFDPVRIHHMRAMILSETAEERQKALAALAPYQVDDFTALFKTMQGFPVTIRLLDPPLHEFLPRQEKEIVQLAKELSISEETLHHRIDRLHESNPMLGLRGCRLAVVYPEIYEMQIKAIFAAAQKVQGTKPEIMMPLVSSKAEMDYLAAMTLRIAKETGFHDYILGTMIELPRAALAAADIAKTAAFFSFGTNDLTQTTLGISRDDAGSFLPAYQSKGLWPSDPFTSIDVEGVGQLVHMACIEGRKTRPDLKIGICGEHGGDPKSILFFENAGLDYVSCSPYRVPIARLAAAQAVLKKD